MARHILRTNTNQGQTLKNSLWTRKSTTCPSIAYPYDNETPLSAQGASNAWEKELLVLREAYVSPLIVGRDSVIGPRSHRIIIPYSCPWVTHGTWEKWKLFDPACTPSGGATAPSDPGCLQCVPQGCSARFSLTSIFRSQPTPLTTLAFLWCKTLDVTR